MSSPNFVSPIRNLGVPALRFQAFDAESEHVFGRTVPSRLKIIHFSGIRLIVIGIVFHSHLKPLVSPDRRSEVNRRAMRDVNRLENRLAEGRVRMNGSGNFVVG